MFGLTYFSTPLPGKYDPEVCGGLIVRREDDRSTGHPHKIFKERPKRDLRKYGFPHRVVDVWNRRRMGGVVKAESVKEFEYRLDSILSNNALIYDYKASTNLLNMNNMFFDDAIIEEDSRIQGIYLPNRYRFRYIDTS